MPDATSVIDLSSEKLADYDFLLRNFYIVDENTDDKAVTLDAASFLAEDFSLKKEVKEPQTLNLSQSFPGNISGLQREGRKGRYHCWREGIIWKKFSQRNMAISVMFT